MYDHGFGTTAKNLARLRMDLSPLCQHLYLLRITDNPNCLMCNRPVPETVVHYLLECPRFANERTMLFFELSGEKTDGLTYPINMILSEQQSNCIKPMCTCMLLLKNQL